MVVGLWCGQLLVLVVYGLDQVDVEFVVYVFEQYVQCVGVWVVVIVEYLFVQLVVVDYLFVVMDEVVEQVEFLWVEGQCLFIQFEVVGVDVQLQWVVVQVWVGVVMVVVDQCVQLQYQFVGLERFCQVVVGVGVEVGQFVVLVFVCGQYQYWKVVVIVVLVFDYVQVIQFGQVEVDDGGLQVFDLVNFFGFVVVSDYCYYIIGLFQQGYQVLCQCGIVFG